MKTSVMEVRDMLSVLSVVGVETRIGAVPGVESVTVNFAAGRATVRFDETRLSLADIRSDVRQSGSKDDAAMNDQDGQDGHGNPAAPDAPPDTELVARKLPPAAASADARPQSAPPSAAGAAPAADAPLPLKSGKS